MAALAAVLALFTLVEAARLLALRRLAPPAPALPDPLVPDVNSDPAPLLRLLPRIGPGRARAIVVERESRGRFAGLLDLLRVRGIGPKTLEMLRGHARASGDGP